MEEWSISQSTDIDVDFPIFDLWLQGKRSKEMLDYFSSNSSNMRQMFADDIILSHIKDQRSLYLFLKGYLEHPWDFNVLRHQLNPKDRNKLINTYYSFSHSFLRELVNHRISSKLRKDVDEIATKLRLPIIPCFRFFDNFRNVLNKFDDSDTVPIYEFVKQTFSMSDDLARSYATVVFLQHFKFDVSKKRLQYLSFSNLCSVSMYMMQHWTSNSAEDISDYIDRELFNRLHECKNVDNDGLNLLTEFVATRMSAAGDGKETIKNVIKEIVSLGAHLKDVKEIFGNFGKVSESGVYLSATAMSSLFDALADYDWKAHVEQLSSKDLSRISSRDWHKFLTCSRKCVEVMHSSAAAVS